MNGIRFYKGFYNIDQHTVSLWTSNGTLLATGASVGESLAGWQTVNFSSPVHINAGTTMWRPTTPRATGRRATTISLPAYSNGPLSVLPGGAVYAYSDTPGLFPSNTSINTNYWVDVVFQPDPNVAPVGTDDAFTIGKNGTFQISFATLLANDTDPNGDTLSVVDAGGATNGSVTRDAQTGNVFFTPNANYSGLASFSYTVSDGRGGTATANVNLTVTQDPAGVSLFQKRKGHPDRW